jgi:hypothetical protein
LPGGNHYARPANATKTAVADAIVMPRANGVIGGVNEKK